MEDKNFSSMLAVGGGVLAALATGLAGFPILGALAIGVLTLVGGALIAAFANGKDFGGMFEQLSSGITGFLHKATGTEPATGAEIAQDPYGVGNATMQTGGVLGLTATGLTVNKIRKDWTPNKLINESKKLIEKHKLGEKLDDDEIAKLQRTLNRADKQINSRNWKTLWLFKSHPGLEEEINKTIKQADRILKADAQEAARINAQPANAETPAKAASTSASLETADKTNVATVESARPVVGVTGTSEIIVDKSVPALSGVDPAAAETAKSTNPATPAAEVIAAKTIDAPATPAIQEPPVIKPAATVNTQTTSSVDSVNRIAAQDVSVPVNRLPQSPVADPLSFMHGVNTDGGALPAYNNAQVVDHHIRTTSRSIDTPTAPSGIAPHTLTTSGLGGALGTVGFVQGYQQGDGVQMAISGADVATSVANPVLQSTAATSALSAGAQEAAKTGVKETLKTAAKEVVKKAALPIIIADGGYQIYKEEGVVHKAERLGAVGATVGAGLAVGALMGGGVVAAPIAAAVGTALVADTAIQTRRIYEQEDQRFKARKDHGSIISAQQTVAKRLKDKGMILDESNTLDLTKPYNVSALREALESELKAVKKKVSYNNGYVFNARWSPLNPLKRVVESRQEQDNRIGRYNTALGDIQVLEAALAELPNYVKDLKEHKAKQDRLLALAKNEEKDVQDAYQRVARHNTKNLLDKNGDGVVSVADYASEDGKIYKNNLADMKQDIAALTVLEKHNKDMSPVKAGLEKMASVVESELKKAEIQTSVSFNPAAGISGGVEANAPLSSPSMGGISSSGPQLA